MSRKRWFIISSLDISISPKRKKKHVGQGNAKGCKEKVDHDEAESFWLFAADEPFVCQKILFTGKFQILIKQLQDYTRMLTSNKKTNNKTNPHKSTSSFIYASP
ncbi:hypothetical protein Droror1_Dr00026356 [Drosera rotundifolia]